MSQFRSIHRRRLAVEGLETRQLMAADLIQSTVQAAAQTESYDNGQYFIADSFSFGVEREMKESGGEKADTEDVNIGIGELQECTISKSMDMASTHLAQFAINGNSPG